MPQPSILNYFNKVSAKSSPSATTPPTQSVTPAPTPKSLPVSAFNETPKSKPQPALTKSRNDSPVSTQKKRAPDSSERAKSTPKRRKTAPDSPSPLQERTRRYNRIRIQDSDDDDEDCKPADTTHESVAESEEEYKPDFDSSTAESEGEGTDASVEEADESMEVDSEVDKDHSPPAPKGKKKSSAAKTTTPMGANKFMTPSSGSMKGMTTPKTEDFKNRIAKFSLYDTPVSAPSPTPGGKDISGERRFVHDKLLWLKPENIKDKHGRRPSDPNYDPKTLYIPKDFLEKGTTPAVRQFWELKRDHFDTLIFFKMGKFYELWHMDAVIGVQELGIIFMKGEIAHCGFPEVAYSQNAEILVARGYKVARCEQTETPEQAKIRNKGKSGVVRREICQITTKGIRLASSLDGRSMPFLQNAEYLYGIVERNSTSPGNVPEYGVCFIDTTIGTFFVSQFKDDRYCSRLRTLFSHYPPVQILHEKAKLSPTVTSLMANMTGVRKDAMVPETEFWGAQKTLKFLAEGKYFRDNESGNVEWPESLKSLLSKTDSLGLTPEEGWELGVKALGGVVSFLRTCLVEHDLLTLRRFETYLPLDAKPDGKDSRPIGARSKFMVLDGSTLRNLEVTEGKKSLLTFLDNCSTSFGKRLLRFWICAPLCNTEEIIRRQNAIGEVMGLDASKIVPLMKSLLDLERLLGKIHSLGSAHRAQEHPDSRASFFDEKKYSKRKIIDLTSVLKGFKTCVTIIDTFKNFDNITSDLLSSVISEFPSLKKQLKYFDDAFNHAAAIEAGKIQPVPGMVEEYDKAFQAIKDIEQEAQDYLEKMKKVFKTSKVAYFGKEKKRYQLELPENISVGNDFDYTSQRKGFRRYATKQTKEILAKMMAAELNRENVEKDITRRIFAKFDESREVWNKAVQCISTLDVLISLAKFSKSQENMCCPRVVDSPTPFIDIVDGRHPCIDVTKYIPNSCALGSKANEAEEATGAFLLLTGANMGGKSTTMKQVGLLAILAHMGCYVPATSCEMSLVDRIFTRIGAADNIAEGESTFFVELSETSAILKHASQDSLILMDELGRGTATHDGNAIAYAVASNLSQRRCRTIFSTHYHNLVSALQEKPGIQVGHMSCMVEREDDTNDDPTQETITFLYKLTSGPCAKSYGFNAARLAGVPDQVIRLAHQKSKELEASFKKLAICRALAAKIKASNLSAADAQLITSY